MPQEPSEISEIQNPEPKEEPKIDDPVKGDPEQPIEPIKEDPNHLPEPEMPIKPLPMDCQKAAVRPFPEKFYYTDCCGNYNEGDGYQPWEKRAPVSVDVTKPSAGLDFLGEEAKIDC